MIEKKDLRRTWFTTESKNYFHEADVSIIWRPAKFETLLNFLKDCAIISKAFSPIFLPGSGIGAKNVNSKFLRILFFDKRLCTLKRSSKAESYLEQL